MIYNLTGQRFNRLLVLELAEKDNNKHGTIWKCLCDCGNTAYVSTSALRSNNTRSCGCLYKESRQNGGKTNKKDVTGQRFGRLVVIKSIEKRLYGKIVWECLCDCGNIVNVSGGDLRKGHTQSCGCLFREKLIKRNTTHGMSHTKEYERARKRRRYELERLHDSKSTTELEKALEEFFPACIICGSTDRLEKDHVLPLSEGYGLKPGNAVILCRHHNASKKDKSLSKLSPSIVNTLLEEAMHFNAYWNEYYAH